MYKAYTVSFFTRYQLLPILTKTVFTFPSISTHSALPMDRAPAVAVPNVVERSVDDHPGRCTLGCHNETSVGVPGAVVLEVEVEARSLEGRSQVVVDSGMPRSSRTSGVVDVMRVVGAGAGVGVDAFVQTTFDSEAATAASCPSLQMMSGWAVARSVQGFDRIGMGCKSAGKMCSAVVGLNILDTWLGWVVVM